MPGPRARRLPMPPIVRAAVLLMFAAFALYSVGVWGHVLGRRLRAWHAGIFWAGFACDTAGTELMRRLAGGLQWNLHTVTGLAALLLMLGHALLATIALLLAKDEEIHGLHRVSLAVWVVWLVPFGTGLVLEALRRR